MAAAAREDITIELMMCGDANTGKTTFASKLPNATSTNAGFFAIPHYVVGNVKYFFKVWDIAGEEKFRHLNCSASWRCTEGFFLLFDVTDEESFQNISVWIEEIRRFNRNPKASVFIIGNKVDLPNRTVKAEQGEQFVLNPQNTSNSISLRYFETSALSGDNIEQIFLEIIDSVMLDRQETAREQQENPEQHKMPHKKVDKTNNHCCVM